MIIVITTNHIVRPFRVGQTDTSQGDFRQVSHLRRKIDAKDSSCFEWVGNIKGLTVTFLLPGNGQRRKWKWSGINSLSCVQQRGGKKREKKRGSGDTGNDVADDGAEESERARR